MPGGLPLIDWPPPPHHGLPCSSRARAGPGRSWWRGASHELSRRSGGHSCRELLRHPEDGCSRKRDLFGHEREPSRGAWSGGWLLRAGRTAGRCSGRVAEWPQDPGEVSSASAGRDGASARGQGRAASGCPGRGCHQPGSSEAIREGKLREDLYYRLNVVHDCRWRPCGPGANGTSRSSSRLHPGGFDRSTASCIRSVMRGTLRDLLAHAWPGNVRELRNAIERGRPSCAMANLIGAQHCPGRTAGAAPPRDGGLTRSSFPWAPLWARRSGSSSCGRSHDGQQTRPARAEVLGISLKTLHNKLHRYAEAGVGCRFGLKAKETLAVTLFTFLVVAATEPRLSRPGGSGHRGTGVGQADLVAKQIYAQSRLALARDQGTPPWTAPQTIGNLRKHPGGEPGLLPSLLYVLITDEAGQTLMHGERPKSGRSSRRVPALADCSASARSAGSWRSTDGGRSTRSGFPCSSTKRPFARSAWYLDDVAASGDATSLRYGATLARSRCRWRWLVAMELANLTRRSHPRRHQALERFRQGEFAAPAEHCVRTSSRSWHRSSSSWGSKLQVDRLRMLAAGSNCSS